MIAIVLAVASTVGAYYVLRDNERSKTSPNATAVTNQDDGSVIDIPSRKSTTTVASTTTEPENPVTVYSNDKYGFSFEYPKEWKLTFDEIDPDLGFFVINLQTTTSDELLYISNEVVDFEIETISENPITIDTLPARQLVAEDSYSGVQFGLVLMKKATPKPYRSFFISYGLNNPEFVSQFETIIQSIQFTN